MQNFVEQILWSVPSVAGILIIVATIGSVFAAIYAVVGAIELAFNLKDRLQNDSKR